MNNGFLEIDTQIDFVFPAGALYAPGAERIIPTLARLNRFAVEREIPLISTACAHVENDPEFREWPPHCVVGTVGQRKPDALRFGQRIFEKRHTDMFQSPAAESLVAGIDEWVVYGVVTEVCVSAAAFGLLLRGKRVAVVEDAIQELHPPAARAFFAALRDRGGHLVSSAEILCRK